MVQGGVQIWGNNRLPDLPPSVKDNLILQTPPRSVSADHNTKIKLQASNDTTAHVNPAKTSPFHSRNIQKISKQCPRIPPSTSSAPPNSTPLMAKTPHPLPPHLHRDQAGTAVGQKNNEEYRKQCMSAHDALENRLRDEERERKWTGNW